MPLFPPSYHRKTPRLISNTVSNADEVSRWVLDLSDIRYVDDRHTPGLHILPCKIALRQWNLNHVLNPVLTASDALTEDKDGVFRYMEERVPPRSRLLPDDPERRTQAQELYQYFWHELWRPVGRLVYRHLLAPGNEHYTLPLVTEGVPSWEKLVFSIFFKHMAKIIADDLDLDKYTEEELVQDIDAVCDRVESLLAGGSRPFLTGDTWTIADLFFAVNIAPLVLPPQFRGSIARSPADLPPALRPHVARYQARPAGQFALRMFRDHRPPLCDQSAIPKEEGPLKRVLLSVESYIKPPLVSHLLGFAQKYLPAARIGKNVAVNRYDSVADILTRDDDFTIKEINGKKMHDLFVPFFLGMDRSIQHDRELAMARQVVHPGDAERVRNFVRTQARRILEVQKQYGKIDVPATLTRTVMTRVIEDYFGVPGTTEASMREWMRSSFHDLFLNLGNNNEIHRKAVDSALALKHLLEELIACRKRQLGGGAHLPDNVLNRMLILQHGGALPWLDDDTVRRNISGLIIGALSTTSKATVLVLDELLRRSDALEATRNAALLGDMDTVRGYAFEALRFNPHNPIVLRHASRAQQVNIPGRREPYSIPAGSTVYVGVGPAMFDPRRFASPRTMNPARPLNEYMLFGHGYHVCFGTYLNAVTIPELVAAVVTLPGLRRACGPIGRVGLYDGPFPTSFLLEFDDLLSSPSPRTG